MTAAARPTAAPQRVALATLALRDYRNIAHADLTLPHEGVAIVGENGHGKTNLLEAIAYLELLRSIRGVRDRDLVRFGAPAFHIGVTCSGTTAHAIGLGVDRAGRKRVTLDGVETPRLTDALGAVPSVCVSPADVVLIAGSPAERRRYLDIVLALTSAPYLSALRHYRAALARRNAALRDAGKRSASVAAIAAWEPALAEHGAVLTEGRREWVAEYAPTFTSLVTAIGEPGAMAMAYESPLRERDDVRAALAALLEKGRDHDLRRGITQAGPHRDDLAVTLDGRDLRLVGSAGQQRTAAIALRLLEATTFRARRDLQPLLLLDDPFAELDRRRAGNVLALLDAASDHGAGQTIICVPREDEIPTTFTRLPRWRVRQGVFAPVGAE